MEHDRKPAPARDVGDFLSGSETVLFRESTQAFCCLNETASIIWGLLKKGHDEPRIAADLITDYGVPESLAGAYARSILSDLAAHGFLAGTDGPSAPAPAEPTTGPDLVAWRTSAPRLQRQLLFEVENLLVEVSADDARCTDLLEQAFGFLAVPGASAGTRPTLRVFIRGPSEKHYTVQYGTATVRDCRLDQVPPLVHAALFLAYYDFNFHFLAVHSAAVCAGGQLLLLPGGSGSGKSSLTAALVARGFGYVTDELLLVDLHAESLMGAPLAIALKQGAWQLVTGSYPEIARLPAFERQDGERVKYLVPSNSCRNYALRRIGAVVFPSVTDDDDASMHPLTVAEAFARFTEAGYDTHGRMTCRDVSLILDWIGAIPAYELCYQDLDKAVRAIKELRLS